MNKPSIWAGILLLSLNTVCSAATAVADRLNAADTGDQVYTISALNATNDGQQRVTDTWTGAVSTLWETPENWSLSAIPASTQDVVIPTGLSNYPVLASTQSCNSLSIQTSAHLTIGSGSLSVTINVNCFGTLHMNSSSGHLTVLKDLIFENQGSIDIPVNALITISSDLILNSGSLVNMASGTISFVGSEVSTIATYTPSSIYIVKCEKPYGYEVNLNYYSTASLTITTLNVLNNNIFRNYYSGTTYLKGQLVVNAGGLMQMPYGTFVFSGPGSTTIYILGELSYFNHVIFDKTSNYTMSLLANFHTHGNLTINSGKFSPGVRFVFVGGNWVNNVGPSAFEEGTSIVTFDGSGNQTTTSEVFYDLTLNKSAGTFSIPAGANVTCHNYNWTAGSLAVTGGSFTASDLTDNGIVGNVSVPAGTLELHQDSAQAMNINGTLNISGGDLHLYGGNGDCQIAGTSVTSFTMSNGSLEMHDAGIRFMTNFALTSNISGGSIRSHRNFTNSRADLHPSGGTIELTGETTASISTVSQLYNVLINKAFEASIPQPVAHLASDLNCAGNLTVQSGKLDLDTFDLTCTGNVTVNSGLMINAGCILSLSNGSNLSVASGGVLSLSGSVASNVLLTRNGTSGYYSFNVSNGGTISAVYSVFEYMAANGVNVQTGAIVDAVNSFRNCTFREGQSGGTLLTLDSSQILSLEGLIFPQNTWGGIASVTKNLDQGQVVMIGYAGEFAGAAGEQDAFGRVHWLQEGLPEPTELQITENLSTHAMQLTWTYPYSFVSFNIYRAPNPQSAYVLAGSAVQTNWNGSQANPSGFFRVSAKLP
jgi:hypothetical protein